MKFLVLSIFATVSILLFACGIAWLCTFSIGSWLVLSPFVAYVFYICLKTSDETKLSDIICKNILPVCIGLFACLALFWFIGHLTLDNIVPFASVGYTIIWGILSAMCAVNVIFAVAFIIQFLAKVLDVIFLQKHSARKSIKSSATFIVSSICCLAIFLATMYYVLYPIGLA